MPMAKKDQTTNVDGKWKMAALIRQANSWHQNETNKTAETTSKTQTYLQTYAGKNTTKSQQSNRLLSAAQQMSGRLHWLHLLQP